MRLTSFVLFAALAAGPAAASDWKLVWSDEFDGTGLPDPAKWTYEEGFIRNSELQFYTRARTENIRLENGSLIIEARKDRFRNPNYKIGAPSSADNPATVAYTSGSLTTRGLAAWRYGRIEVRAKLPTGRGTWPAIWMLGANEKQVGWPKCGEIDIMEHVGHDPGVIHATVHSQKFNHVIKTAKGGQTKVDNPWGGFHIYAVEWSPERMDFYADDEKYFSYENEKSGEDAWPFDQPFFLILNVAIGGSWGGQQGVDDNIFPQRMEIDYVRIFTALP